MLRPFFLCIILSAESLNNALAKLIISNNLPFQLVESESLPNVVKLLNPAVLDIMVKADAVTDHVMKMYFPIKDQVKARFAIDAVS